MLAGEVVPQKDTTAFFRKLYGPHARKDEHEHRRRNGVKARAAPGSFARMTPAQRREYGLRGGMVRKSQMTPEFLHHLAKLGQAAHMAKSTKAQRSANASKASIAGWNRLTAEQKRLKQQHANAKRWGWRANANEPAWPFP